jgi:galactoside O-acetyltransferase
MITNIYRNLHEISHRGALSIIGKTVRIRRPELFSIGRNSIIDDHAYISCGLKIGQFTHVGAQACFIGGEKAYVEIGDFCNIAPGCKIAAGQNDYYKGGLVGPAIPKGYGSTSYTAPVKIGDHCLLGFNVSILAGVHLPEGVAIGANSLLKPMKYRPWGIYCGTPAKEIGVRLNKDILAQAEKLMKDVESGKL